MFPTDFLGGASIAAPSYAAAQSDGAVTLEVGGGTLSTGGATMWGVLKSAAPFLIGGAVLWLLLRKK